MKYLKKRNVQIIILLVVALIVYVFNSQYNKPHLNVAKEEPGILITSKKLIDNYKEDENKSNTKYLDQVIKVTGKIADITTKNNKATITLGEGGLLGNVVCQLLPSENKKVSSLQKGQVISLKGICTGYLMDVILIKSVLTN